MLNPRFLSLSFYETELTVGVYPHFSFGNALFFLMVENVFISRFVPDINSSTSFGFLFFHRLNVMCLSRLRLVMAQMAYHTLCKSQKKCDNGYKSRIISPESFEI